jgi:hypothetical protein
MPGEGAYGEAEAAHQRPGQGGAGRPFPDSDDDLIEAIAERIAATVETMPKACRWCVRTLANGSAWCDGECEREWRKRLMPHPHRDEPREHVADAARIRRRKADLARAAAWRAAHR